MGRFALSHWYVPGSALLAHSVIVALFGRFSIEESFNFIDVYQANLIGCLDIHDGFSTEELKQLSKIADTMLLDGRIGAIQTNHRGFLASFGNPVVWVGQRAFLEDHIFENGEYQSGGTLQTIRRKEAIKWRLRPNKWRQVGHSE